MEMGLCARSLTSFSSLFCTRQFTSKGPIAKFYQLFILFHGFWGHPLSIGCSKIVSQKRILCQIYISDFKNNQYTVVAGSTWKEG